MMSDTSETAGPEETTVVHKKRATYVGQILDGCFDMIVKFKFDMRCQLVTGIVFEVKCGRMLERAAKATASTIQR